VGTLGVVSYVMKFISGWLIWVFSVSIASLLRYDGSIPTHKYFQIFLLGIIGGSIWTLCNIFLKFEFFKNEKVNLDEVIILGIINTLTLVALFIMRIVLEVPLLPRSISIISGLVALLTQFTFRVIITRRLNNLIFKNSKGDNTIIYGAGIVGRQLAEQIILKSDLYKPVGFLDDNSAKYHSKVIGLKVFGSIDILESVARDYKVKHLIVAISQIETKKLAILEEKCRNIGLNLKIVPNPFKILMKNVLLSDLTSISEEDLLGRRPKTPDETEILKFIKGKKILITGAGGSIGSEIAMQVKRFAPSDLYLLDRDESSLLSLELQLFGSGLFSESGIILADLRDSSRIKDILINLKPDIVFHAAALKHLSLLETFPEEAFKTNCLGTKNLLDACLSSQVKYFVNISTDKAADPISNLGKSKLITERLVANIDSVEKKYISVRFGNVIGSKGSFLVTFRHQIDQGDAVTVTHPHVSRYFMTISEAVHLVLQSVIVGKCGETLILDMGEPVSIAKIAERMIKISGKSIPIKYTGLRRGEKLNEKLIGSGESTYRGAHEDIMHTRVAPLNMENLEKFY